MSSPAGNKSLDSNMLSLYEEMEEIQDFIYTEQAGFSIGQIAQEERDRSNQKVKETASSLLEEVQKKQKEMQQYINESMQLNAKTDYLKTSKEQIGNLQHDIQVSKTAQKQMQQNLTTSKMGLEEQDKHKKELLNYLDNLKRAVEKTSALNPYKKSIDQLAFNMCSTASKTQAKK